jgi:amino acid transporter
MDQPPTSSPTTSPQTSKLAIWSLVLGILGLMCFWIITGIPAVICGHKARRRIKESGGALRGSGLALGGLITGYVSILTFLLAIPVVLAIALPALAKAKTAAQTAICVQNLRTIDFAKEQWSQENQKQPTDVPKPEDINSLMDKPFSSLTCPLGGKYSINAVAEKATCSIPGHKLD